LAIFSVANQLSRNRPGEPTRPHSRTMAHSPTGSGRSRSHRSASCGGMDRPFRDMPTPSLRFSPSALSPQRRIDLDQLPPRRCGSAHARAGDAGQRRQLIVGVATESAICSNTFEVRTRAYRTLGGCRGSRLGGCDGLSIHAQPSSPIGASFPTAHPPRFAARHR
jgi:hypothetical protein